MRILSFTYIKLQTLRKLSRVRQNLASLERRQSRKWLGIEARVFETKTTIHRVGCKFQRLLFDVVLTLDNQ
jgi:hypothetical protein